MKLASLPHGRDGRLIVVSRDLHWYADADHLVPTLQAALDSWDHYEPALRSLSVELEHGTIPQKRFHEREAAAPLPRAYQSSFGAGFRGARDALTVGAAAHVRATACAITGDVPQGAAPADALAGVRLVGLALAVAAQDGGATLAVHCSPVFVTLDELGDSWRDGHLLGQMVTEVNAKPAGAVAADQADLGALIADLAQSQVVGTGAVVGSAAGEAVALGLGDVLRIEMRDSAGHSIFGAIEGEVV